MIKRFDDEEIKSLLVRQITSFYPLSDSEKSCLDRQYLDTVSRMEYSFSKSTNKYYHRNGDVFFDPLHSCQWFMFLYLYANTIFHSDCENELKRLICDKLYGLSKIISSCDLYYEVEMPAVWFCDHPMGSVIGRAKYGDFFSFAQGCTVGNNHGIYPVIGDHVSMLSNSKIIGNSRIGNNVIIAANAYVKDADIPDNSIVFGQSPSLIIKDNHE